MTDNTLILLLGMFEGYFILWLTLKTVAKVNKITIKKLINNIL